VLFHRSALTATKICADFRSGQEQDFSNGAADPYNRAALWPSNYTNTSTYQHIARLNKVRKAVIANNTMFNGQSFLNSTSKIIASTATDVAIRKGPLLAVLTNVRCVALRRAPAPAWSILWSWSC
jgi:alpha-amylase